jgi:hypothetical protein
MIDIRVDKLLEDCGRTFYWPAKGLSRKKNIDARSGL